MSELAVVVPRAETESVLDSLAAAGLYDDTRSIQPHGEGVAIPVTDAPDGYETVRVDLPPRNRDLRELLAGRGWSDADLDRLPTSWAVVGSCLLVQGDDFPDPAAVGDALLELHGEADTVLVSHGIAGDQREPDVEVIAGTGDTEVVHTEHGTKYALDLARVMFSPGNQAERARMGEVVAAGERVFDMFAGIGYFTLPMARAGADVTAAEINPEAYRYLVENAVLNGVQDRLSAFRADCRDVDVLADRVVMGYYDAPDYLDTTLAALDSGVVHLHATAPTDDPWTEPVAALEAAAGERLVEILDRRVVKSHAPGVDHVVVDARIGE
ncbi:class I SAM-dependent methyltransferase [Halosegnis longus]|uniref:Class I SAM-dependent methyltransferase family protein n=1 Tax=Halosegnis longus TaxID=2216012 RepID=A0AAJ4UUV4_9EURY|nr:class I SAM-dependent methyltransferase family protein [Halosegnis longus]RNJ25326.1 class I SAM-dependent methyltransferase family protein [Salella cibi]